MPVNAIEPKRESDLLKATEPYLWGVGYMVDFVTVNEATATDYEIGMLLGTDGTKYKISDPAASDGSEEIVAVVLENKAIPATTDTVVKVLVRGPATITDKGLVLGDHALADAKAALLAMNPPVLVGDQL